MSGPTYYGDGFFPGPNKPNERDCEHGHRRATCDLCDANVEIRARDQRIAALERERDETSRECDEAREGVWTEVCAACNEFLPQPAFYDDSPIELIYRIGEQRDEWQQRAVDAERERDEARAKLASWHIGQTYDGLDDAGKGE